MNKDFYCLIWDIILGWTSLLYYILVQEVEFFNKDVTIVARTYFVLTFNGYNYIRDIFTS